MITRDSMQRPYLDCACREIGRERINHPIHEFQYYTYCVFSRVSSK